MGITQAVKAEALRLGFVLAGVTTPDPPPHYTVFESWVKAGRHAEMAYLASPLSLERRADPRSILSECRSILSLGIAYPTPSPQLTGGKGRVASYAWGDDYHDVLPDKLQALVSFIEAQLGKPVGNRWYTDSAPLLERDLAQRAGLGWIGKNTCLINPRLGSYLLLAEILLDLELEPDEPFTHDRCGACRRCIEACPTGCILPDRTLDAGRCISYLTIELKGSIPLDLRPKMGNWIFGCDVCQQVCPWNRFAPVQGNDVFTIRPDVAYPSLASELRLTGEGFSRKFQRSPVRRAKRGGYLRNVAVAMGNQLDPASLPSLESAMHDPEPLVRQHAAWAIEQLAQFRSSKKPD